ncbi:MAG: histidinol phosphate phosphatase [Chitinispirillia bacterium]|nr:histidinol phosphate phosphatase [Chitinispirillia bacterium]MCL2241732.1 histidinol phosphate phosphatase [Chitinispirillia bacterium]
MTKETDIAVKAAAEAGKIQLDCLGTALDIERKGDSSPVTRADKLCEAKIREIILGAFPGDAFLGEETGESPPQPSNSRRWIVDPIDGTRPFIRGIPTHSVLIALEEDGVPVVGVIHLPGMGLTCRAVKGGGAFLNDVRISVSSTGSLSAAMGSVLGITEYAYEKTGRQLIDLTRAWDYTYGFMDAYSYVLLACGKLDACVNLLDKPWDCAAAACIVTEAGGAFSDIRGEKTVHNGSVVLTNGLLHGQILKFFING